jgi:hypothetical protein
MAESPDDGGPMYAIYDEIDGIKFLREGWTVRDEFAARAMTGFYPGTSADFDAMADVAYTAADAMMRRRKS